MAVHQAAIRINKLGGNAGVLYVKGRKPSELVRLQGGKITAKRTFLKPVRIDERLKSFGFPVNGDFPIDTHFIVPELYPGLAYLLLQMGCPNVSLWWLSVDNFPLSYLKTLENQRVIRDCGHLCQSFYAADFVKRNGGKRVSMLSDEIDLSVSEKIPSTSNRSLDICFLPKKATGTESILREMSRRFSVKPLENMSRDEIKTTLLNSKIFLDFGHHPGKDRVPREAALCGAIPVVRKEGAARYQEDVPLPQDLLLETDVFFEHQALIRHLEHVIENGNHYHKLLDAYRSHIENEHGIFESEILQLIQSEKGLAP